MHDIQLSKLWKLRFENYLQCRTQSVKATISSCVANICGIPQGSIHAGSTYILTNYHFWFLQMILICFLLVPTPSKSHEWGIGIIFYNKRLLVFKCCITGKLSSINLSTTNYTVILINKIKLNLSESEMRYLQKIYIDQNLPWGPLIQHVN